MNIETVITVTHFSVSVKQLIGFLRACIDFPRTCFWAAGTSSPRLLPNFSSIWLPANLVLGSQHLFSALAAQLLEYLASRELAFGSQHLFSALAAQTSSRQTTAEQVLAHSRLKNAAINQQVHLPTTKKSPYGLFFANSFYIRRS